MSSSMFRMLSEIADTNPESLSATTKPNFRFWYIDIRAVNCGFVNWNAVEELIYKNAPSRARRLVKTGDVLFGTVRPNLQSHGFLDANQLDNLVASTGFSVIRAKEQLAYPSYLFHCVMSNQVKTQAEIHAIGSNYPAVNDGDIRRFNIFAPSIKEQVKIAQILDILDTNIRQTEAIIAKLQQVKQGLLHDLLTRGIDANGQLRPPVEQAPYLYKESPLGWIPREWTTKLFKQLFSERTRNGLYKPSSHHGGGPLMVQMGGLFRGEDADFSSATRVRVSSSELIAFGLADGDLLFARRSLVFEGAGQCVIVHNLPEASTFESSIVRVRVERSQLLPEFAALFLSSSASYADRRTFIRQVAVSGVSSADISQFLVVVPPIQEQKAIVERFDTVKYRINCELLEVEKLSQQKSALMDDLLTGRVRVTALLSGETPVPEELERESA